MNDLPWILAALTTTACPLKSALRTLRNHCSASIALSASRYHPQDISSITISPVPSVTPMAPDYYPLLIAAFHRGVDYRDGTVKPYHWALFIRLPQSGSNRDSGVAHQLHGMPGGFYYLGAETIDDLGTLGPKCNELDIGNVPISPDNEKMARVEEVCRGVEVVKDESAEWNCQDWTVRAVEKLKEEGFIDEWITEEYMRGFLKEV